jgi:hypothetical protein
MVLGVADDGDARFRQQAHLATELDEPRADFANGACTIFAKIGDHLVIGDKATQHPQLAVPVRDEKFLSDAKEFACCHVSCVMAA